MAKQSGSVEVIVRDLELNPKCIHGPTILFSRNSKRFFSCAGIRSNKCFYLDFDKFQQKKEEHSKKLEAKVSLSGFSYDEIISLPENERIYCGTCCIFVATTKIHDHESHDVLYGITNLQVSQPSLFLPQLDDDKLNAQYFFDENTLDFIYSMLEKLNVTKVICIGVPRLHDYLRSKKPSKKSILLDIDGRFQAFNHSDDFIRYNMFNNFFFDKDEEKLKKFLIEDIDTAKSQHIIFTDPPFAARTELLAFNLRKISSLFNRVNSHHKILPIMLVFPYFNEHHIQKEMPEMEMLDFQVSYLNHKAYFDGYKGRKAGSPVRIFSNIDPRSLKFSERFTKYRFCQKCHRSVSINNNHCLLCKTCPSKNGTTYKHCEKCVTCVKPNYIHCAKCDRCVQKTAHDCLIFQLHQECWLCGQRGHVEKNCDLMKKLKRRKDGSCLVCKGSKKHNLMKCPMKLKFLKKQNEI